MVLPRAAASYGQPGLLLDWPPAGGAGFTPCLPLSMHIARRFLWGAAAFFVCAMNGLRLGLFFLITLTRVPRTLLTCRLWRRCITKNNRRMRNVLAIPVSTTTRDYRL